MTLEELQALITSGEGETLEVKETTGQRVDACETLCAFLNKDGGMVVFGVGKKGNIVGQLVSDKTKRELFEVFASLSCKSPISKSWMATGHTTCRQSLRHGWRHELVAEACDDTGHAIRHLSKAQK